jgi:hypothetical protein
VLLVSGPPVELWCHGAEMRAADAVRCSEPVGRPDTGGLIAGVMYVDPAAASTLRCTRRGDGWPKSSAGALAPTPDGRVRNPMGVAMLAEVGCLGGQPAARIEEFIVLP